MSTDRKRLTSAIQRIAREDPEIRNLLDDFRNSGGKPSASATSGSGAEDRQICCDGSTSDSTNPGSSTRDASDGGQDASGGLGDNPADLGDMGGGSLFGVKDCASGEPICFDGADWIPPEGWDSPSEPPPEEGYLEGTYWAANVYYGASPGQACSAAHAGLGQEGSYDGYEMVFANSAQCYYRTINDSGAEVRIGFADANRNTCPAPDGSNACEQEPAKETAWPEDGCINLANKGGKLVASKYDPEAQGTSYLKGVDSIELCDDFGNSFSLTASGSIDGGWKSISADNPGDGYLYNAQGEQIARISESEYSDPTM